MKTIKKRKIIALLLVIAALLVAAAIVIAILHNTSRPIDYDAVTASVGVQEITEREISIIRNLGAEQGDEDLMLSMHMYSEIRNMLLFEWAQERGVAPTDDETQTFIDDYARDAIPASHFEIMGISAEEYWDGFGFRNAQNLLTADRILEYLNDNDPETTHSMEQYPNYIELGRNLMQEWKLGNQDLARRFSLNDAAEVFAQHHGS